MKRNNNSFIKNTALLGIGLLGLKYILPKINFNPNINVETPDTVIDYTPPNMEIIHKLPPVEEEIIPSPGDGSCSSCSSCGGNDDDDPDNPKPIEPIINYPPIVEEIIHRLPPIENDIKPEPGSITTLIKKLPEPYPITKKIPITQKSDVISTIKGVFVDMVNELMLGDKTWFYSQQDIINMETLYPNGKNTPNPQCCEFIEYNQPENKLRNKDIFY